MSDEMKTCIQCKQFVKEWNERCGSCGMHLVMEPDEQRQAKFLRGPSLGALLFTQGWTFGARLYIWFLVSLIPGVGLVALFMCLLFGRRWSWKQGGWASFDEFRARMRLLDLLAIGWIAILLAFYFWRKYL